MVDRRTVGVEKFVRCFNLYWSGGRNGSIGVGFTSCNIEVMRKPREIEWEIFLGWLGFMNGCLL